MAQEPTHSKPGYYRIVRASLRSRDFLIDAKSARVSAVGWLNLAQSRSIPTHALRAFPVSCCEQNIITE